MSDQSPEEGFNDQYLGHNQEQEGISYSQSQNYHKGQKRMQNNYQQYGDEEFEDGEIVDDQQNEGSVVSKKSTPSKQMVFSNGQPIIENPEKDQNDMMHQDDMEDHNNEGQIVNSQAMHHATHQNDKLIDRTTPLQNVSATLPYPDESSQLNQEGQLPVTTQFDCGNGGYLQENNDDDEHMDVEMAPQFHHEVVQENENEQMNQVEEINSASFHTAKDYENSQNPEEQEGMIQDDQEQKEEIVESVEDQFQQQEEEEFAREVPESVQTVEEEEQFEQPIAQPSSRAVSPKKSTKSGKKSVNKSQRSTRSRRGKKDQVISDTIEEEEISDKIEPEELQAALSKKKKRGKESAPAKNNPFSPDKADVVSKPSTRRSRRNQLLQSEPKSEVPQKSTRSGRKSSRSKKSKQVEDVPMYYEEEPIEDDSQIVMPMIEEDDEEVEEPEQLPSQRQQQSSEKQFADQIAEEQDEQFGLQVVEQEHVSQVQFGSQQVEEEEQMVPNPDILDVGIQQEDDDEDVEQQEEENASVEQQQESIEQVDDETVEEASPAVEDDAQPSNDTEMVEQPSVQEEQIASATEDENDEEIHESQQNVLGLVQEDVPQPVEDSEEMEDVAPEQNSDDEEEEPESPEEQQNNQVLQQDFQEYEEQSNGEQQYVAEEEQVVEDQEEESETEQVEQIASEKESDDDEEDEYVSAREDQDDEEQNEEIQVQEVENEEEQGEEEAEEADEVVQQEWQEQADEELVSDEEQQVLEDPIIDFYNNFDDDEEEEGEYIPNSSSDTPNAHTIEDGESEEFQIQEQLSNQESQQQAFFDPVTRISPSASNKKSAKKEKTPSRQSPQNNVNQFSTPQQMPKQKSSQHHSSVPKIMQPHQDLAQIINQKNTDTKGKKNKGKKQQPEKKENDEKEFEKTITNSATKLSKDKRKRVQQLEESINYLQTILDQEQSDQMMPPQQAQHGRKSTKPFMDDIIDSFPDFTHVIPSAQKNKGQQMMQKNMLKQMRGARPKKVDTFDIEESTMNQFGHVFENEIEMGSFQNQQVQPKKNQSVGKLGGRGRPPKNKSVEKSPAKPSKQKHMSLGFELNDNSQVEQSNQQLKKRGRPTKQEQTIQQQESEIIGFAAGVEDEVLPTEEDFKKKGGKKNKNVKPFKDFVPETIGFKAGNNPFLAKKSKGLRTLIATPSKFADRKQSSQGKKKTVDKKLKSKGIKKTEIMKLLKDKTRKEKQKLRDKRNREQVQKQQLKLKKKEKKLQMLQKLAMKRQKVKEAKQFMVEKQKENAKLQREKLKILKAKKEQREADKKAKSEVQAKIKATVEKEIELRKQKLQEEKNKIRAEEKRAQEMAERKAMKARSSYNVPVSTRREQKQLHKDAVKKQSKKTFSQSPPPKKIPTPSVQNKSNNSASKSVKNSATKSAQNSKTKSLSNLKVSKSLRTSKTVVAEKKELRGTRSHAQAKTPPKQPKEMIKKAVTTKEKVPAKIQEAVKQKSTLKSNESSPGNAKPKVVEKVKISKTNSAMSDVKSARSKASPAAQSLLGKKRPHAEMMKKSVTSNKKGQEKSKQTFKQPLMRTRKSVRK